MKSPQEVYAEVEKYIKGDKHNRPCTLSTIKKTLRTKELVDLIFSNPKLFDLTAEIKHVPSELLTDEILTRFVLLDPRNFTAVEEINQTVPVLIAFEYAKRKYERESRIVWGIHGEKIAYTGRGAIYKESISDMCDEVDLIIDNNKCKENQESYIREVTDKIITYCKTLNKSLTEDKKYERKYKFVDFNLDKRLFILVSGLPDSGKTHYSVLLHNSIKNAILLDSDVLYQYNSITSSLQELVPEQYKTVIFCDTDAFRFFKPCELGDVDIINILVEPSSYEKSLRNSKRRCGANLEEYTEYSIRKSHYYEGISDPIKVTNDYTDKFNKEVDRTIEEIAERLGLELAPNEIDNNNYFQCDWQLKKIK